MDRLISQRWCLLRLTPLIGAILFLFLTPVQMLCCSVLVPNDDCRVHTRRWQLLLSRAPVLHCEALSALVAGHSAVYGSGSGGTRPALAVGLEDPLRHGSEAKIAGTEQHVREVLEGLRQSPDLGEMVQALLDDAR